MKEKSKTKKRIITRLLFIICMVIFVYSAYQVIRWVKDSMNLDIIEKEVFSKVKTENKEEHTSKINFDILEGINTDIFAWIEIENTNIDYPILQGETDEYYLRKDIYKKYNHAGCIFVDSSTKIDFSEDNTVLYGHNLRNGKMFSELKKVNNGSLGKDIMIKIYTRQEDFVYRVFSSYIGEQDLKITQKNFTPDKKENFIHELIKKSGQNFVEDKPIDYSKNLLTLVTCDETSEKRIIVCAIKQ